MRGVNLLNSDTEPPRVLVGVDGVRVAHGLVLASGDVLGGGAKMLVMTPEAAVLFATEILRVMHSNNLACMAEHRRTRAP